MADLLNLGSTALLSLQRAIATTGNNISNVNTEGYSRQRVNFDTAPQQFFGGSFYGNGVRIDSVERIYDQFLAAQVVDRTASQARYQTFYDLSSRLDGLLADPAIGLGPVLDSFFGAVQDVANNPGSLPERQVLLSEAQVLTDRFQFLDGSMRNMDTELNARIENTVAEINSLSDSIAQINREIASTNTGPGGAPNGLLDDRDRLLEELAQKINVTTLEQSDGTLNVTIGNGQPLVVGFTVQQLQTADSPIDASQLIVGGVSPGGTITDLGRFLGGGELGALLDFREQVLDPARNQLGLVATGVANSFNEQHRLGLDLNGQLGGDFFRPLDAVAAVGPTNSGLSAITATISDPAALTGDNYNLRFSSGQWVLTNLTSGAIQTGAGPFSVDGLTVSVTGAPVEGDTFVVQPTRQSASLFGVVVGDPNAVAAASPLRSQAALANAGSGAVRELSVSDASGLPLSAPVTLVFNPDALGAGIPGYDVTGIAGGPLPYDPATESNGKSVTLGGFEVTLGGVPQAGDELSIENNTGGSGDNRNALALAGLQTEQFLYNGSASYQGVYAGMVADIGVQTRQAETGSTTEGVLLEQSIAARDSVSGVNLDEEAANLIRYQQAYQAAAQVIAVADQLFQTLLNATRR